MTAEQQQREAAIAALEAQRTTLGDERAAPMLEQLHADVQATAAQGTDAADRERLIQAIPDFCGVVAAYGRRRLLQAGG